MNILLSEPAWKSALLLILLLAAWRLARRASASRPAVILRLSLLSVGFAGVVQAADTKNFGLTPSAENQNNLGPRWWAIPALRGQILDRNGLPLTETRVSYNLAIAFPPFPALSDDEALEFARRALLEARGLLGRNDLSLDEEDALRHYKNRDSAPMSVARQLRSAEREKVEREHPQYLTLQPVYQRFYPNGPLASHLLGYAARFGNMPEGAVENTRGRDGLEAAFDRQLRGKLGQCDISFDTSAKKVVEEISVAPQPGANLVTTLDMNLQRRCENALKEGCKRGAFVILDPNTGDILAMASWPNFNPNSFVPRISDQDLKALNEDPDHPMVERAYCSAYPPGSAFKVIVGLAALQTGKIAPDEKFPCPPSLEIGGLTFRNWKRTDSGMLNFAEALTQSCDTWFYQAGLKVGSPAIVDYARRLGFGQKTGLPIDSETNGRVPRVENTVNASQRDLQDADTANLSAGQGNLLVSPLQMAQAMGVVGTGGIFHQTRLVKRVQSSDGKIIDSYDVRNKQQVEIAQVVMSNLRQGMVDVVSGRFGDAHGAQLPDVEVAGKTGVGTWGPKENEKSASWFAGFVPAREPRYAFAVLCERDAETPNGQAWPFAPQMAGKVLRELCKDDADGHDKSSKE